MMPRQRSVLRIAAVIAGFLILDGCDNPNFGDQARAYVDNEAYDFSKRLFTADMTVRWPNSIRVALIENASALEDAVAQLPNIASFVDRASAIPDDNGGAAMLAYHTANIRVLRRVQDDLDRLGLSESGPGDVLQAAGPHSSI